MHKRFHNISITQNAFTSMNKHLSIDSENKSYKYCHFRILWNKNVFLNFEGKKYAPVLRKSLRIKCKRYEKG